MKRALITGITGQDGSYLAELLLGKGYEVHGIIRRASTFNTHRLDHLYLDRNENPSSKMLLHYGDLSDPGLLTELIYNINPDEVYHLAAQSHVRISFDMPEYTGDVTGLGTLRILESIRRSGNKPRFYQASSSELFGSAPPPQNELTHFQPRSPYAVAKLYAYWTAVNYREAYNIFASNGILFNHESPRRGEVFVTRKITRGLSNILAGRQSRLFLGNLDAKRDWGFAPEFVEMMWLILQHSEADDFVVGTGESHSVRDFIDKALAYLQIELEWTGKGTGEKGIVRSFDSKWKSLKSGQTIIEIEPRYFRPTEVDFLRADISKAEKILGWKPKVTFEQLVKVMVDYDLYECGILPPGTGIREIKDLGFGWTDHEFTKIIKNES